MVKFKTVQFFPMGISDGAEPPDRVNFEPSKASEINKV